VPIRIPGLGAVVIGRNETKTLGRALESVSPVASTCVYVDSASHDDSVAIAETFGASVLRLTEESQLSPARARNEGLALLQRLDPDVRTVFFLDGDCVASVTWLEDAFLELERHPDIGLLCGHLQEDRPELTVFNRLFDLEWQDAPDGATLSCGGIFLARVDAVVEAGAFEPRLRSGEELHMCWRMVRRRWKVVRIPGVMARHDADMHSVGEWLARSRRDGYGAMQVLASDPLGVGRFQLRTAASAWLWTGGWTALTAAAVGARASRRLRRTAGSALPIILAMPVAKALQIARRVGRRSRLSRCDASLYGMLMMMSKWSYSRGQLMCVKDLARGGDAGSGSPGGGGSGRASAIPTQMIVITSHDPK
jgi:hypothetical protein